MKLPKHKMAVSMILITIALVAFVLMPPVAAEGQTQSTDTTFHNVTVNMVDGEIVLQIEPLLLPERGCISCAENQTCPSGNEPTNIQSTILEQEESHIAILLTYEVNGTTFEVTVARTLLWSYEELTDEVNRTASFVSTEITAEDVSTQFYSLSYLVQHEEYNLTAYTNLTPLNSETYNSSFTIMNYAPAEKPVISMEFVEFNSSVTLSQQYAILGKVAKEVGKVYEKSGDETFAQLAQGYYTMEEEAKHLAKLVEKQLQQYNKEILKSSAILMDDACSDCLAWCEPWVGIIGCGVWEWLICSLACAGVTGPFLVLCPVACGFIIAFVCFYGVAPYCWYVCTTIGACP